MRENILILSIGAVIVLAGAFAGFTARRNSVVPEPIMATEKAPEIPKAVSPPIEPQEESSPQKTESKNASLSEKKESSTQTSVASGVVGFLASVGIFMILLGMIPYFVPTIIALVRGHKHTGWIFFFNGLLGWTGVCWIAAMIWSCTGELKEKRAPSRK